MDNQENMRRQELLGFAEAADHAGRSDSGIFAEEREGRIHTMVSFAPRQTYGTLQWSTMVILQVGAKLLKALLLIFDKLDQLEALAIQQEMRERKKEGR